MRLIIDADPIVYRAGFAAESHHYHVVAETEDGEVQEGYFKPYMTDKGKWITSGEQMQKWTSNKTVLAKEKVIVPEPKENALHLVGQQIRGIMDAANKRFGKLDNPQVSIVLTGPGNFREKIAKLKPYKGNRDLAHKPYHYQAIRDYLTGTFNARVVKGREADDECSILGWDCYERQEDFAVATIDKDLDQVPGWHYDYRRKVWYQVSVFAGERRFWEQVLSGDATDNIGGCYKIGLEKAERIVDEIVEDAEDLIWPTPDEFWRRVISEYTLSKAKKGCPYMDSVAEDVAIENARLVYMQRKPRELWVPPGHDPQWLEEGDDE